MTDLWAVLSLGSVALGVVVLAVLHVIAPDLSPVEHGLSEYARTVDGWLYPIAATGLALAAAFLGVGLRDGAPLPPIVLLWLCAAATLVAAVVRTDPTGRRAPTPAGFIHATASVLAGLTAAVAAPLLAGTLIRRGGPPTTTNIFSWVPAATLALSALTVVARSPLRTVTGRPSLRGVGDRFAVTGFVGWLCYAAVIRLS